MAHHTYAIRDQILIPSTLREYLGIQFEHHIPTIDFLAEEDKERLSFQKDVEVFIIRFVKPVNRESFMEALEFYGLLKGYRTIRGNKQIWYKHRYLSNKTITIEGPGHYYDVCLEESKI